MIVLVAFFGLVPTDPPHFCVGDATAEHNTMGGGWVFIFLKTNIYHTRT